jgi:hypothetical protein
MIGDTVCGGSSRIEYAKKRERGYGCRGRGGKRKKSRRRKTG